jgi:hypothetical protein
MSCGPGDSDLPGDDDYVLYAHDPYPGACSGGGSSESDRAVCVQRFVYLTAMRAQTLRLRLCQDEGLVGDVSASVADAVKNRLGEAPALSPPQPLANEGPTCSINVAIMLLLYNPMCAAATLRFLHAQQLPRKGDSMYSLELALCAAPAPRTC